MHPTKESSILDEPKTEPRGGLRAALARLRPSGQTIPRGIEEVVRVVRSNHPKADVRPIVKAFEVSFAVHQGQLRKSGEPFISHPVGVALILAELGMDPVTLTAALLHDTVEDTDLELGELHREFGEEVAALIDGLTKIEKIGFRSVQQRKAENLRKMIVAMARDPRVLIIKFADRLHNLQTIGALDPAQQELTATETLEIYAPLAYRLGMQAVKADLEDLSFKILYPKVYEEIEQMVLTRQPAREEYLQTVVALIENKLRESRIKGEVSGRPKHYYSIYEKMVADGREFDEIFDLVGVRIIVESLRECYGVLGAIHASWKPVPGRFKDYIAMPKFNLYQSLHTTVVGPEGKPLEIQIRTGEMHLIAQWGVASHWQYKQGGRSQVSDEHAAWMTRMLEMQQTEDDAEFLEGLRLDLFSDDVFVFTPKGEVIEMSKGATPIDFAYAIHTEVGHNCVGAKVDGRLAPLNHELVSGETVEIIASKSSRPSRDWLDIVVTPRARTKIRQWFTKEHRDEAISEGRESLIKAFRRAKLPVQKLMAEGIAEQLAVLFHYHDAEALYVAVGEGRISALTLVRRHLRETQDESEPETPIALASIRTKQLPTQGVLVEGDSGVLVKLARCCMPVPTDPIMGFVTKGRGVSVHRSDCSNAKVLSELGERLMEVSWAPNAAGIYPVSIQVESLDRPKLLRDVTTAISDLGLNISQVTSHLESGMALLRFTLEVTNPSQLHLILNTVRKVEGVFDVHRLTPNSR